MFYYPPSNEEPGVFAVSLSTRFPAVSFPDVAVTLLTTMCTFHREDTPDISTNDAKDVSACLMSKVEGNDPLN
jgi:hypothetical protein